MLPCYEDCCSKKKGFEFSINVHYSNESVVRMKKKYVHPNKCPQRHAWACVYYVFDVCAVLLWPTLTFLFFFFSSSTNSFSHTLSYLLSIPSCIKSVKDLNFRLGSEWTNPGIYLELHVLIQYMDYGHTKAKYLILCDPNSNPNSK